MEKFSKWRDRATGLHPFLPVKPETSLPATVQLVRFLLIGLPLIILRIPFILVLSLVYLLISQLTAFLPTAVVRFIDGPILRLLLFFMGFWWIPKTTYQTESLRPGAGDIMLCNHLSYIDVLYLASRFGPIFGTVPTNLITAARSRNDAAKVRILSFYEVLKYAMWPRVIPDRGTVVDAVEAAAFARQRGRPLLLLPEGATANGALLLYCPPGLLASVPLTTKLHLLAIRYPPARLSPAFPIGNFYSHFVQLISELHNSMQLRYNTNITINRLGAEWEEKVYDNLAQLAGVKRTKLGADDKEEFSIAWIQTKQKVA